MRLSAQEFKDDVTRLEQGFSAWKPSDEPMPVALVLKVARRLADLFVPCPDCAGVGRVGSVEHGGLLSKVTWYPCGRCDGTGVAPGDALRRISQMLDYTGTWQALARYLYGNDDRTLAEVRP